MWDNAKGMLDIILLLCSMLAMIAFTYIATRWLSKRFVQQTATRTVRIVDKIVIGQDKALLVIAVANQYMLISAASGAIIKICDLRAEDVEKSVQATQTPPDFAVLLQNTIKEKFGKYGAKKEQEENPDV